MEDTVPFNISGRSQYILSTSGRITSLRRYQRLLQEKLNLDIVYLPITSVDSATTIDPAHFSDTIRGLGAIGGAISKDIKGRVIPFLDELDDSAAAVQSVNTVIRKGQRLIGYNTDTIGFREAIAQGIETSGEEVKSAVVYGYGGVFNVVHHVLSQMGLQVYVTGRNPSKVEEVRASFDLEAFSGEADLFVNATPVTDAPLAQATGLVEALGECKVVFDHHMPGAYLQSFCEENGKYYIPGTAMYHPQMLLQWSLFLAEFAPGEKVKSALADLI